MNQKLRTILTGVMVIGSIVVIAVTLVLVVKEKKRARVIQDEISALEQDKKRYEHENTDLKDRIAYLQSAHSYEKEAKKLNYKKPGEHVVIVRRLHNEQNVAVHEDDSASMEQKEQDHYRVWLKYFF